MLLTVVGSSFELRSSCPFHVLFSNFSSKVASMLARSRSREAVIALDEPVVRMSLATTFVSTSQRSHARISSSRLHCSFSSRCFLARAVPEHMNNEPFSTFRLGGRGQNAVGAPRPRLDSSTSNPAYRNLRGFVLFIMTVDLQESQCLHVLVLCPSFW